MNVANSVFATLELDRRGALSFGTITRAEIEAEVHVQATTDTLLRVINLNAHPRRATKAAFADAVWLGIWDAAHVILERRLHMMDLLGESALRSWVILDATRSLRRIAASNVRETVAAWKFADARSGARDTFLVEFAGPAETDLETLLERIHHALAIAPVPSIVRASTGEPTTLIQDVHPLPLTSEQATIARRDALLARARSEAWPESGVVGQRLGSTTDEAGRQRAARDRQSGRLLGVRPPGEHTFVHPCFQFLVDGRIHPLVPDLLAALARNPELTGTADPGGWGRLGWLYQPRRSLSERSLAEDRAADGVTDDQMLDSRSRAPAEVFPDHPKAVIALAKQDAEAVSGRR